MILVSDNAKRIEAPVLVCLGAVLADLFEFGPRHAQTHFQKVVRNHVCVLARIG